MWAKTDGLTAWRGVAHACGPPVPLYPVQYLEQNLCPDSPADADLSGMKLDGAQTQGPALTTVFKNISEYAPVWPRLEDGKLKGRKGYLFNGRKSADVVLKDGLQLNICNNRYVKTQTCFYNEKGQPVTLEKAALRVFDIDHSKKDEHGPEAIQFQCKGGTFSTFGDSPFLVHLSHKCAARSNHRSPHTTGAVTDAKPGGRSVGKPTVEKGFTKSGLNKYTYDCPGTKQDPQWVTMWSARNGKLADNPESLSLDKLTDLQLASMTLINFTDVKCTDVIFANMPGAYKQENFEFKPRNQGGNPLNSTLEIKPQNFPELGTGACPVEAGSASGGRNWIISGMHDLKHTDCRGSTFDDPHIQTLSGAKYFMHGTGVYDYASSGDVESQVYLCPFAPCTEKMMAKGECLTFIQAVAVKTPKHNLVFRSDSLYVDGAQHAPSRLDAQDFTLSPVGGRKKLYERTNHKELRGCPPDPSKEWLWTDCTEEGWRFESTELSINLGMLGPFEEGWLNEIVSNRTFNLDVYNVSTPATVRGLINGDRNGVFEEAGAPYNALQRQVPQVTAENVRPDRVLFPKEMVEELQVQCGAWQPLSATLL